MEDDLHELGRIGGDFDGSGNGPGDLFVASKGYKSIRSADLRPQQWTSGPVEVIPNGLMAKGTLLQAVRADPAAGSTRP